MLRPAGIISGSNILLEIAPPVERPVYLGFANTVLGLTLLATGVGGLVVDWFGFEGLFVLALACQGLAFVFSTRLREPRGENEQ
jgi:MFS family permease